ncbi:uncharacterized protein LOC121290723 [Carcharodon carcharias]|uniref:uncharacterized protein LOC121290723 n=1 Tax=Carcharodon carcharias TaxID=13397 RepID=UPI001B7F38B2|nr:uncharacterized protein LOC121290723 [Carcharodon carcharias]
MRSFSVAAAAFLLNFVFTCNSTKFETIFGLLHGDVYLPFVKPANTSEIVCKLDGNKVFEWEGGETQYFGTFLRNTELQEKNVFMQRLQKNNTGHYILEFTLSDGKITKTNISLIVLERLTIPKIICTGNVSMVLLMCDLNDTGSFTTTKWEYQKKQVITQDSLALSNENKHLTILNSKMFPEEFVCIVNQPGNSNQSDPFLVQNCFETKEMFHRHHYLVVSICVFVVLACVCTYLCFLKPKQDEPAKISEGNANSDGPKDSDNTSANEGDFKMENERQKSREECPPMNSC